MPDARAAEAMRLQVRKIIRAPRDMVFRAWITPASITRWFATPETPIRKVEVELRAGGRFYIELGYRGGVWRLDGVITELDAPRRLAFTWVSDDVPAEHGSVVTVDLTERAGVTELVLTQDGFPGSAKKQENEAGWTELMANLARDVETAARAG